MLYQILSFTKKIKTLCKNKEFKTSAPTCSDTLKLPGRSYSVSDIEYYFEYILKKHGEKTNNPSIRIRVNKIENRIDLKLRQDIVSNF